MEYNSDMLALRGNSIVVEQFTDMMLSQTGRNKIGYVDKALEAIADDATKPEMLNKLYKETFKIDEIDFGTIPDTKGDITKYRYYPALCDVMDVINRITAGNNYPEVEAMNKLHRILLDAKKDFEYGYKYEVSTGNIIIMCMYKIQVMNLFMLSNEAIVTMTAHLRKKLQSKAAPRTTKANESGTLKNANQFIKMYESGQWSAMIKNFKSGKAMESLTEFRGGDPAVESGFTTRVGGFFRAAADLVDAPTPSAFERTPRTNDPVGSVSNGARGLGSWFKNLKTGGKVGVILAAIIAALGIIRYGIYLYFHGAVSLKDCLKNNAEILRANINSSTESGPEDSIEKQKKFLAQIENTSDVIEYKIMKNKKIAEENKTKADREVFNPDEIRNLNGNDFEF